jgi:hypothetical protein
MNFMLAFLLLNYFLKIEKKKCEKFRPIMNFLDHRLTNFAFTFKKEKEKLRKKLYKKISTNHGLFGPMANKLHSCLKKKEKNSIVNQSWLFGLMV